ncbi:MAG: 50S ribosomal protein L29 [Candidatus Pacebacteria bacterium]|nr:50S ribosomal protein L29 [Candidatus Paceibacterota bacterium]
MNKYMQALKDKNAEELAKLLGEKREELRAFRFGTKGSRTRDTLLGMRLRKDIARIQTITKRSDIEQSA